MTSFNTKIGLIVLLTLGAVYMVAALASGHSAVSHVPPDLRSEARDQGLDVWKAAHLMLSDETRVAVLDIRSKERFEEYHLPGARSMPGAGPAQIAQAGGGVDRVLLVAAADEGAQKVIARLGSGYHYLEGGARAWYLAMELPVPLFSDTPPPNGYREALAAVKEGLLGGGKARPGGELERDLATLARLDYAPTLLGKAKKARAGGKKRKKLEGGCD